MIDLSAAARAIHVAAIVHWIGGLFFVTFVVLPGLRELAPEARAAAFAGVERRFARQARVSVALAGLTGFYMMQVFSLWGDLLDPHMWRLAAMLAVWTVFAIMLFVAEPLFLHDLFDRRSRVDPEGTFRLLVTMHRVLSLVSLVTVLGVVAGAHGFEF